MGACHNEGNKKRGSSSTNRKHLASEKDSVSTQSNDKRRGKTPNDRIKKFNYKDTFTEKEILDLESNRNNNSKLDIISKIDKISL